MGEANPKPDSKPVVTYQGPNSIEELLHFVDPGVDDETERFVASIYEDRRGKMGS